MNAQYRLGIDIGGTFTDFCLMNEADGTVKIGKVPSTPADPTTSVIAGIERLSSEHGLAPEDISYFVHGTTIGVNTIIERRGATTGLLVTKGFPDLLNIGRSRLPDIYDLLVEKPEPLVQRRHIREIDERILANGRVYRQLSDDEVRQAVASLVNDGVEAITVSFLHAYRNADHERRARRIIEKAWPELYVSVASEIWPQIREYERTLVGVINAFIGRKMKQYFVSLEEEVRRTGIGAALLSTKSNGGIMTARRARELPVETLSSGPASGVIGAHFLAQTAGSERVIALDMGGTSTEVAVIDETVHYSTENKVGDFEIVMPAIDVSSIGAGGGSIAWTDQAGVLKVGPRSAGADPGPACYGRGGEDATITDAYLVLGILDPARFLGGDLTLRPDLAEAAIDRLAVDLGYNRVATAEAIIRVATSNMYSELVPLMARKGVDVSEYALLTYGGAGPVHGPILAKEVGMSRVLVPLSPGTLCALGALVADAKSDFIATIHSIFDPADPGQVLDLVRARTKELTDAALGWIEEERINVVDRYVTIAADMRYLGQSFEVTVDLSGVDLTSHEAPLAIRDRFVERYASIYGGADYVTPLEIINLRATAMGVTRKPEPSRVANAPVSGTATAPPARGHRQIYFEERTHTATIYGREELTWGHTFDGPAIVEQYDSTLFVPTDFACTVDPYGTIIAELKS